MEFNKLAIKQFQFNLLQTVQLYNACTFPEVYLVLFLQGFDTLSLILFSSYSNCQDSAKKTLI